VLGVGHLVVSPGLHTRCTRHLGAWDRRKHWNLLARQLGDPASAAVS
jgi:hypothetical protein